MDRTKVLLAFGNHSGGTRDKRFFKKAVVPFLEARAREGRRTTIIYEFSILPPEIADFFSLRTKDPEKLMRLMEGALARIDMDSDEGKEQITLDDKIEALNEIMKTTVDAGKRPPQTEFVVMPSRVSAGVGFTGSFGLWGFEEAVLRLNRASPGTITNELEPQNPQNNVSSFMWRLSELAAAAMPAKQLEHAVEMIKHVADLIVGRDLGLFCLIEKIVEDDPGRAIVIPRGWAHRGMAALFDENKYETDVRTQNIPRQFGIEAASVRYYAKLDERMLAAYAALELHASDFLEFNNAYPNLADILLRIAGAGNLAHERLIRRARDYALSADPESRMLVGY